MKEKKKPNVVRNKGMVYASGKIYTEEEYEENKRYNVEYEKKIYRRFNVRFRKDREQDIIDFLVSQDNVQDYLRNIIRKDMEAQTKKLKRKKQQSKK